MGRKRQGAAIVCAVSGTSQAYAFEEKAGAGETRFGFLEFGDVNRRDVEASGLDAGACAWK